MVTMGKFDKSATPININITMEFEDYQYTMVSLLRLIGSVPQDYINATDIFTVTDFMEKLMIIDEY